MNIDNLTNQQIINLAVEIAKKRNMGGLVICQLELAEDTGDMETVKKFVKDPDSMTAKELYYEMY